MPYLADTTNLQFISFWLGTVGWILVTVAVGLIQWRVWYVADQTIITSGVAWVGIWRTCFFSDRLVSPELRVMYCQYISMLDTFTPVEICVSQVLMVLGIFAGAVGNAVSVYTFRNIFFRMNEARSLRITFSLGGALYILSSVCVVISVGWNINSVLRNHTIDFPANFYMPSSPSTQEVGSAIYVGISAAILLLFSGIVFVCYMFPERHGPRIYLEDSLESINVSSLNPSNSRCTPSAVSRDNQSSHELAMDNPAFQSHENITIF
ncbi:claudin-34-like [Polyodon spathula]|nr:claudin-34-like [Polyodon spathula]